MPALIVEVALSAGHVWGVVRFAATPPRPPMGMNVLFAQVARWILFAGCMIAGLAVDRR